MEYNIAVEILNNTVYKLELPKIKTLDNLNNEVPTIFLCGKSSSGKTTFLNALFNLDKNELYTSTDVSTKAEFRFKYGNVNKYLINGKDESIIPSELNDRKELYNKLNTDGLKSTIYLNEEALNTRVIVDIPGVFDYSADSTFSNNLLDEADIVYFFTPCMSKITAQEFDLIKKINYAHIPLIILFTMGDITEPDEGITRKTMPDLVRKRMNTCFENLEISHYQIISSNDFYKGKVENGIDKIKAHIAINESEYKKFAERGRLRISVKHYINIIESEIIQDTKDSKDFIRIVNRENELRFEIDRSNIDDEYSKRVKSFSDELEWFKKSCNDLIWGEKYSKLISIETTEILTQKQNFGSNWDSFWEKNTLKSKIPIENFTEDVFQKVSVNKGKLDKLINGLKDRYSIDADESKKTNETLTLFDLHDLGVNISNAKIIFNKWSFLKGINSTILKNKVQIISQLERKAKNEIEELNIIKEKNIEISLLENISNEKLLNLKSHLEQLNKINNDF
jgi:energy-coupling factor transporter ATP-binding protein EcfA2